MNKRDCYNCLFGEHCVHLKGTEYCEYYYPLDDSEDMLDEYIEEQRKDFHSEWFRYTSEDYE